MLSVSSSVPTPQPAPSYILRGHIAQLSILTFALDGRSLYSGLVLLLARSGTTDLMQRRGRLGGSLELEDVPTHPLLESA